MAHSLVGTDRALARVATAVLLLHLNAPSKEALARLAAVRTVVLANVERAIAAHETDARASAIVGRQRSRLRTGDALRRLKGQVRN